MSCYAQTKNEVFDVTGMYAPCKAVSDGSHTNCCYVGDICMSDGLCQYVHSGNPGGSGFYAAGCTDPDFKDSSCPRSCGDQDQPDAVYDFDSGEWKCCGIEGDTRKCGAPLGVSFNAPAPGALSSVALIVATNSISSVPETSVPTVMAGSTGTGIPVRVSGTACPTASSKPGLSNGAYAGIGLGYAILALALIGAIALIMKEKKKNRRSYEQLRETQIVSTMKSKPQDKPYTYSEVNSEVNSKLRSGSTTPLRQDVAAPPYRAAELHEYRTGELDTHHTSRPPHNFNELQG